MPKKPMKPCAFPGCPKLTGERFCPEHKRVDAARYERYQRSAETAERYGAEWRRIRDAYAREHPLCEMCLREGRMVPMQHVHHVKPLAEGGTNEWGNLIALCKTCHSRTHAERGDRWRTTRRGG